MTPEALPSAPPDRVTVAEAARILDCSPETVRRAIRDGRLAATRPLGSRGLLIRRADLEPCGPVNVTATILLDGRTYVEQGPFGLHADDFADTFARLGGRSCHITAWWQHPGLTVEDGMVMVVHGSPAALAYVEATLEGPR